LQVIKEGAIMDKYDLIKLENQLCFPIYALSREIIKSYKPFLDKFNLTYTQYITMLVLWEEEKTTFKNLGKRLHLDSGTLTPVLKKLESMDLIIKYRTKEDDRVVEVELTEKGRILKDDILEVPEKMFCGLGMSESEALELKVALDNMLKRYN
jgi:DNA-binding MarR family transcriptional regulator